MEQRLFLSSLAAQVRQGVGGAGRPGVEDELRGCEEEEKSERRPREARPHPPPPQRTQAAARERVGSPPLRLPAGARGRGRRVRVPRPTATWGESELRPSPGPQGDLRGLGPRAAGWPAFPARCPPLPPRQGSLSSPGEEL